MNKTLKATVITIATTIVFIIGLFISEPLLLRVDFIWGMTTQACKSDLFMGFDQKILSLNESGICIGFCCDQVLVYLFYLALFAPISFFLFSKKQKLPAILFTAFGVGIIAGTFVCFLIMP